MFKMLAFCPLPHARRPQPVYGSARPRVVQRRDHSVFSGRSRPLPKDAFQGSSMPEVIFSGVGRCQGSFDHVTGELSDAASALDWAQTINPDARACWVAGFSFGAW